MDGCGVELCEHVGLGGFCVGDGIAVGEGDTSVELRGNGSINDKGSRSNGFFGTWQCIMLD
jgi:hypothetical protein